MKKFMLLMAGLLIATSSWAVDSTAYVKAVSSQGAEALEEPPSSKAAKQVWRLDASPVARFVAECLRTSDDHGAFERTTSDNEREGVFNAWRAWSAARGVRVQLEAKDVTRGVLEAFASDHRVKSCRKGAGGCKQGISGIALLTRDEWA